MPRGPFWTPEEEAALREEPDFEAFAKRIPWRSQHAWRQKRAHLGLPNETEQRRMTLNVDPIDLARERMLRQADRNLDMNAEDELPQSEEALERLFMILRAERLALHEVYPTVRTKHWYAPEPALPVGLCGVGDVHAGGDIEYELFERDLELIRDTDGLFPIFMGDLIDNFKPQAKSGTGLYEALIGRPDLQTAYIATRTRWVKDKIVAMCKGNHEGFDGRWAGIDSMSALARDLGCTYFTEAGGSIFAYVGDHRYHIICKHDWRGRSSINKGNAARRIWDEWPWSFESADAVLLAHLHEPHSEQPMRKGQPVAYLRTGTYKLRDSWAESNGYRPSYGVPMLILYPDERRIIPIHGDNFLQAVRFLIAEREHYRDMLTDAA